jgi:hypothetical protein
MRFAEILCESSLNIKIAALRMDRRSVKAVLHDLAGQKWSRSTGPVEVIGTEYNQYQLGDGYHRVLQAILCGQTQIRGTRGKAGRYAVTPPDEVWRFDPQSPTFGLETFFGAANVEKLAHMARARVSG